MSRGPARPAQAGFFDPDEPDHAAEAAARELPDPTYTVAELVGAVNQALRSRFDTGVWVTGEITGWSERGVHAYFRLADPEPGVDAVLDVSFFAPQRQRLRNLLERSGLRLGDGVRVRIHGSLDVYAPSGRMSLKLDGLDPRHTLGDLAMRREAVLRRLTESGAIGANGRRPMPVVPLDIAVVTSADSAAWADVRHELERSGIGFRVRLVDVRVQGPTAAPAIAAAIGQLSLRSDIDLIALVRGGGARTELATFDDESIALAIARCPVPVLTGLGHEIDRAVADEVAHLSLKTPTACAAAIVERVAVAIGRSELAWETVRRLGRERAADAAGSLASTAGRVQHRTVAAVARADERLTVRVGRLGAASRRALERGDDGVARAAQRLRDQPSRLIERDELDLEQVEARLRLLDPARLLERGWSITTRADGAVVRSAADVVSGDRLHIRVVDGSITSTVAAVDVADPDEGGSTR